MLRVLYDNFVLTAIAVAAAIYLLIRVATRGRTRVSASPVPGLGTALITGVIGATILVLGTLVLFPLGFLVNRDRLLEALAPLFLFGATLFTLAVLIVHAIWPARPGDRAEAVGRALAGFFVVLITVIPIDGALRAQVGREAEAERLQTAADEQQGVLDRSAALSIAVTVVDAQLGGRSTHGGHIVTHLSLDIEVRSATDIELRQSAPGFDNHWINVIQSASIASVQPDDQLELPTHLSAGFAVTHRLEVPIDEMAWSGSPVSGQWPLDDFTTGRWEIFLSLYGAHPAGTPQAIYRASTTFTVPDRP